MTKEAIRKAIDDENGAGFSNNFNLNGYVFQKNGSFIVFELKLIEDVKVCHIKYIHFKNEKDLTTILVYCCNFWMGNKVQFIFYREKHRKNGAFKYLCDLGFRDELKMDHAWKWRFECVECNSNKCVCAVHNLYK